MGMTFQSFNDDFVINIQRVLMNWSIVYLRYNPIEMFN